MPSHSITVGSAPSIGYPEGTSVSIYPVSNWPTPDKQRDPSAATPVGSSTATASVSSGNIAFGSVADGDYWAYASVGGNKVYRLVHVGGPDPSGDVAHLSADQTFTGAQTFSQTPIVPSSPYRMIHEVWGGFTTAALGATNYGLSAATTNAGATSAASNIAIGSFLIPITATDWAVSGLTTKLNLQAVVGVGTTAPAQTATITLNAITVAANAIVVGAAATGSSFTIATPGANAFTSNSSGDFTIPSDGIYMIVVSLSGAPAGNFAMKGRLRLRNV